MKSKTFWHYPIILLLIFIFWFIGLAIDPTSRYDWALENILTLLLCFTLLITAKKFPFSRISYSCIFIFLMLHVVGSHYTYAKVPYEQWSQQLMGFSLNELMGWQRNNFDRVVHFCYGLLLAYPIRELFVRIVDVKGFWGFFLPFDLTMSTSLIFEWFEWAVVELVAEDVGQAYLGTQGDVWDAHKDMALAASGGLISMLITALINWHFQKDFAKTWRDSFSVKYDEPLGEVAMEKMIDSSQEKH